MADYVIFSPPHRYTINHGGLDCLQPERFHLNIKQNKKETSIDTTLKLMKQSVLTIPLHFATHLRTDATATQEPAIPRGTEAGMSRGACLQPINILHSCNARINGHRYRHDIASQHLVCSYWTCAIIDIQSLK